MDGAVSAGAITKVISSKSATPLEMAPSLCFLPRGCQTQSRCHRRQRQCCRGRMAVRKLLHCDRAGRYAGHRKVYQDGVNNLAVFDVNDLFSHKNASFTTSQSHFASRLKQGEYEACVDIRRCRIGGVFPIPIKVKQGGRYELLGEAQLSYDQKPDELIDAGKYALEKNASKELTWQRRLLDLSLKNNLLNFRYRHDCLHIVSADVSAFYKRTGKRRQVQHTPVCGAHKGRCVFRGQRKRARAQRADRYRALIRRDPHIRGCVRPRRKRFGAHTQGAHRGRGSGRQHALPCVRLP